MGIFKRNKSKQKEIIEERSNSSSKKKFGCTLMYGSSSYVNSKSLMLSAVYRCIEVISDSMGELPLYPYVTDSQGFRTRNVNHPTYRMLNERPNPRMSRFTFVKTMVTSCLMEGNAYAYIERDESGMPVGLHYLPNDWVTIKAPQWLSEPVSYSVTGFDGPIPHTDMIHIINFSYDGVEGVGTLEHAKNILSLSFSADKHALGFYSSGCGVNGILSSDRPLRDEQVKELKENWRNTIGSDGAPGGLIVVEGGLKFETVSIDPSSSQLLETRTFNVNEVCRFFGVSPTKCYDFSNNSFSSLEANQLSFLTDTLTPIIAKWESELNFKLFSGMNIECHFDTDVLIKNDKKTLSEYYSRLFNIGAINLDEIRRSLDLPALPDEIGKVNFTLVNVMPVKNAVNNTPKNSNVDSQNEAGAEKINNNETEEKKESSDSKE